MAARRDPGDWERFASSLPRDRRQRQAGHPGQGREVRLALVCLLAEGHLLIEDVPGVGKTMLAKSIARSIDCSFRRIQFTPDLLPTDVTGVNVFNQERGDFEFKPGAIFANIVLADEINRASPKTQSALLESMEERQVTVDAVTYHLGTPFMVIATQNPIEHEGTYPLPEAQLDRFMMRLSIGYPERRGRGRRSSRPTAFASTLDDIAAGHRRPRHLRDGHPWPARSTWPTPSSATSWRWPTPPGGIPTCTWEPAPAPRSCCCARPEPSPRPRAATT